MFVVVVLYCVQLFLKRFCFQNLFLFSFAIAFVSYLVQFSWHPLLDVYGVSNGVSMVFLWDSSGVSKGCLWFFYDISMGFLWDFHDISLGFLWDFHDISIGFLWVFHDISIGFL